MAIRCCWHHDIISNTYLPGLCVRLFSQLIYTYIYVRLTSLIATYWSYICCTLRICLTKSSFVLIPSQHRSFYTIAFGLGILPTLCHEHCFVYTYYLESRWFLVRRYYNMRRRVRRLLPSRTIIVISLSVHSSTTSTSRDQFRPALLLFYWPSYSFIEEYIPSS